MARPSKLKQHPKELTLAVLKKHKQPMSAYEVLEKLKPEGVRGATVVYRALNALMKEGLVHKVQAFNAFVACNCATDHTHDISVLTICYNCKSVKELHQHSVIHQLEGLRQQGVPLEKRAVIELPIACCSAAV